MRVWILDPLPKILLQIANEEDVSWRKTIYIYQVYKYEMRISDDR